jgi:PBSX family phage terminase large subunit
MTQNKPIGPWSPKQLEFMANCTRHWNLAHGAVSTGKTVGTLFAFMHAVDRCPDNQIFMVGHSSDTIYQNAVRLILETDELSMFRPFCTWYSGHRRLHYKDKIIQTMGAKDEGALGKFRGLTASLMYCDEMTLYPENVIMMIDTRLRKEYSMGFAAMNPTYPSHICKEWIDKATAGDSNYYALHFELDDNPFLDEEYKERIRNSSKGIFYKRNVLGLWCLAEGAIFDFFDRNIHVVKKPPAPAEYWIAGIDYGFSNAFACLLIGVNSGIATQTGKSLWVEKEFYWDYKKENRQLLNSEFADKVQQFLEPYAVRCIYIDPSAASMKLELTKRGMHVVAAENDVYNGIQIMTNEMNRGVLTVCVNCTNLIREIESYVWDEKKAKQGEDAPVKKGDHAVDALRYCIASHKVAEYKPYAHNPNNYIRERFKPTR